MECFCLRCFKAFRIEHSRQFPGKEVILDARSVIIHEFDITAIQLPANITGGASVIYTGTTLTLTETTTGGNWSSSSTLVATVSTTGSTLPGDMQHGHFHTLAGA